MASRAKIELVRRGITQREIAADAGTHETRVSEVMNGRKRPSPAVLAALIAATGLTEDELFEPAL